MLNKEEQKKPANKGHGNFILTSILTIILTIIVTEPSNGREKTLESWFNQLMLKFHEVSNVGNLM